MASELAVPQSTNVIPVEIVALDLDWDLILHLARPDSVRALQAERVSADLIEDRLTREVFNWQMDHLRSEGTPATPSVLEAQFEEVTIEEPQTTIGDLIIRIRERFVRNEGRKEIRTLAKKAGEDPLGVASEMLRAGRKLSDLVSRRGERFGTGDFPRALEAYNERVLRGPGPTLGFKELDDHFNGIQGITFLLAPPKTYKTWGVTNAALEANLKGLHPYVYTLELPAKDMKWRYLCMAADIPYWKYEKSAMTPADLERVEVAARGLDASGVFDIEKPAPGERDPHTLVERAMNAGADVIYIDQLQYLEPTPGSDDNLGGLNDTGKYWKVLSTLRDYSDEIPLFVVHQFNRSVMKAKEMPEMQQAKGSSAIEEVGHLVLGLWANKEMRKNNVVEIGTLASRSYGYANWQLDVSLSRGCNLSMIGEVEDDDEE